jgi:hypothetical protein
MYYAGKEYVAGFVASRFKRKYHDLVASPEEESKLQTNSWVVRLNKSRLTIPSFEWRNNCAILDEEFRQFHFNWGKYRINTEVGVLKGFTAALIDKYPNIPSDPLSLYMKTKLFIRIKDANEKIKEKRKEGAQKRAQMWGQRQNRARAQHHDEEDDEEEDEEQELDNGEEDNEQGESSVPTNQIDWALEYRRYISSHV